MFLLIVALERFTNDLCATFATGIAVTGKSVQVPFASHKRSQDPHSCHAGDIGQDIVELEIHQVQCLLHMLDMDCTSHDEPVAVAHQTSQSHNISRPTEGGPKEHIDMQFMNPL